MNTYGDAAGEKYTNREYWRDPRDRIYAWSKSSATASNPMENGKGDRYVYDFEGQLTWANYEGVNSADLTAISDATRFDRFAYDKMGNRKGANMIPYRAWVTFNRRDNGLNQYLNWTPPMAPLEYEANGVLTSDGFVNGTFNALNQPIALRSATLPTGSSVWFGFDPLGRCVKRWTSATGTATTNPATYLYYDGWNLIEERDHLGSPQRAYVHGGRVDEIVADFSYPDAQWRYHHYDARSHCILLTDSNGQIIEQYQYDAFGKPYFFNAMGVQLTALSGAPLNRSNYGNRFLFTGREWLSELRLYDYRHRHYLPELQ